MNSARMLFTFGFALVCAIGCSDSRESAFISLKQKAEAGDATAQYELGGMYDNPFDAISYRSYGVSEDPALAMSWYRKAAEQGHMDAQLKLGWMYYDGKGVPKDAAQAVTWWRKAAEQGNAEAQRRLGVSYLHGDGIASSTQNPFDVFSKENEDIGIGWLRKAATQGDVEAQLILGEHLREGKIGQNGRQLPPDAGDYAEAVSWYRKAAEQGNVDAQYKLGLAYAGGEGVPKDPTQGVAWLRKAAEQGNTDAMASLGLAYGLGKDVPKDRAQAAYWIQKAAELGDTHAQRALGTLYVVGEGVPRDYVLAYKWWNLASSKDKTSGALRDIVVRDMNPEQIAEGQRLTREWKPGQRTGHPASASGTSGGTMDKALTGTAFVVSSQGHLLTNRHVVGNCQEVRLAGSDKPLKVLPQDEANDLALLQMSDKPKAVAVFRAANDLRQGESIAAYGYPLQGTLAAGGNLAPGVVSALAGLGNNTSQVQITAPVQQGNSGGPVLDGKGQVVGVVVQKLDAVKVARLTGDVPQNVNFAINESTTRAFLDSNQVGYKTGNWWNFWQKDLAEIAEDARDYTVVVECWK